jgi:hypothetical protein
VALTDNQNKVIYWDEVNWQWLPFVTVRFLKTTEQILFSQEQSSIKVNSKEEVLSLLKEKGYTLSPISSLGITEVYLGCYLYKGKVYQRDGKPIKSLPILLSLISGKRSEGIRERLKGLGVLTEEQVESLLSKRDVVKFNNKVYSSYYELAKDYEIPLSTVLKWVSKGLSLDEMVSKYVNKSIEDHLGNKYSKVVDMLSAWGISHRVYQSRKNRGWSLDKILTTPINKTQVGKECLDFNGKAFQSISLMAKEHGVSASSLAYHTAKGKTPAEALKILLFGDSVHQVKDHLGNSFSSYAKMTEYWEVGYNTFKKRRKNGWSLEEALTGKRLDK